MNTQIKVFSKVVKLDNGKTFRSYWTHMNVLVKGKENKGKQLKSVTVKFRKNIDTTNITNGVITGDINFPFVYEIIEDTFGNKTYPTVWIRSVDKYEPLKEESPFVM